MSDHDQFRIHLSLVSHTNIGKTTLARTLLMRDVGEVADRAHVTETTDDYVLARDSAGCELVLWDTPGFGNSVTLAKRLAGRSNPIGWFLSEIWDRMTNKAFWLNQRAIKHVRDISSVVLYLVNASDLPKTAPYITAEMQILSWIDKPVIVLLNQMGKPRTHAEEQADVAAWREAMAPYPFVKDILPMDAFARCWVQETALFDSIGRALPAQMHSTFDTLRDIWTRSRRALYLSSVDAMARHMWRLLQAHELVPTPTLKDHLRSFGSQIGLIKTRNEALEDAQTALSAMAADSLCSLTDKLIGINGLTGSGVSREILRRMKTDWQMASHSISPGPAAAVGAGVGVAEALRREPQPTWRAQDSRSDSARCSAASSVPLAASARPPSTTPATARRGSTFPGANVPLRTSCWKACSFIWPSPTSAEAAETGRKAKAPNSGRRPCRTP